MEGIDVLRNVDLVLLGIDGALHIVVVGPANVPDLVVVRDDGSYAVGDAVQTKVVEAVNHLLNVDKSEAIRNEFKGIQTRRAFATVVIGHPRYATTLTGSHLRDTLRTYSSYLTGIQIMTYDQLVDSGHAEDCRAAHARYFAGRETNIMALWDSPHQREAYAWQCRNYAQGRYRMTCANGHSGYMRLCYGHVWMIQHHHSRAKNGLCPRCVWPPRARELDEMANRIMRDLHTAWPDERARLASRLEDVRREMDELRQRGVITSGAPLRLEEIS